MWKVITDTAQDILDTVDHCTHRDWVEGQLLKVLADPNIVMMIVDAYESGVGHGVRADDLQNPYNEGGAEYEAYRQGVEFGLRRRRA